MTECPDRVISTWPLWVVHRQKRWLLLRLMIDRGGGHPNLTRDECVRLLCWCGWALWMDARALKER